MNETEKSFREDLDILLKKYNATIQAVYSAASDVAIEVDACPEGDSIPCANFEL